MIRCPVGHWLNGPIEFLTWQDRHKRDLGAAAVASSSERNSRTGARDGSDGSGGPAGVITGKPGREGSLLKQRSAYYLGGPARLWDSAMRLRRRRTASDQLID
jgi:hypothetical protein